MRTFLSKGIGFDYYWYFRLYGVCSFRGLLFLFGLAVNLFNFTSFALHFHFLIRLLMNLRGLDCRLVTCSIFLIRLRRASTFCTFRGLRYLRRAKDLKEERIGLHRISHSGRLNIRTRTNRRRLSLLNNHILHFVRGSSNVIRYTSTRGNRKNGLSSIRLRVLFRLNNECRILRNIVR